MVNLILSLGLLAVAATGSLAAPQFTHPTPTCLNLPLVPNDPGCPPNPNLFPHCDNIPHVPNDFGCPPNPNINGIPGSGNNLPSISGSGAPISAAEAAAQSSCMAYKQQCTSTFAPCGQDKVDWDCYYGTGSNAGWAVGYCRSCQAQGGRFVDLGVPGVKTLTPMDVSGALPADFDAAGDAFINTCNKACPLGAPVTHVFWENGLNHTDRAGFCACDGKDQPLAGLPVKALDQTPVSTNATAPVSAATPAATTGVPAAVPLPAISGIPALPAASAPAAPAASPAVAAIGPSVPSNASKTRAVAGIFSFIAALAAAQY
ncbi:hypothetical protein HDU87_000770 [Geranomyces variabilis]|uniref:Secreted protein n=1 Tax=Geranomyces variabilis TaxID=109894 RepID=A0AAD5TNA6_9FUNG|nr:hypothetical protein HDU87_000770 [Geranomyces variabilis]